MESQAARAEAFKSLHARPGIFAIPNPWDAGSAKMLAALGFEALATTSAGFAYSIGRPDGEGAISRAETLANAGWLSGTTQIISSGDRKAIETAEIIARELNVTVEVREAMHENDRSATGFLPPDEFETVANRFPSGQTRKVCPEIMLK